MFQSVEEMEYWLTPRSNIITCYVVEVRGLPPLYIIISLIITVTCWGNSLLHYIILVLQSPVSGEVTDMFSFYHLPSTVMNHPLHNTLNVAYLFYSFHTATPLKDLLFDALVMAKKVCTSDTLA